MNIVFIDYFIRASKYGIGTYNRFYFDAIKEQNTNNFFYVEILTDKTLFTEISFKQSNFCHIKIPLPVALDAPQLLTNDKLEFVSDVVYFIVKQYLPLEKKDTVIHLNSYFGYFLAKRMKEEFNIPIVIAYHFLNAQQSIGLEPDNKTEKDQVEVNLEIATEQISDRILCMSQAIKDILINQYGFNPEKIKKIHCGINPKLFEIESSKEFLRKKLGYSENEKVIVYCGRLDAQKGVEYIILAFKKLIVSDIRNKYRLLIIGEGFYDDYLELCDNVWTMVNFTGYLNSKNVAQLLNISDIGIVPSIYEPFGLVVLEMMASGIPVIASNVEGPAEIIEEGVNGEKIPMISKKNKLEPDIDAMVNSIILIANNDDYRMKLIENSKKCLNDKFSNAVMLEETINCYKQLVSI